MKSNSVLDYSTISIQSSPIKVNHYQKSVDEILQAETLDGLVTQIESQLNYLTKA